MVEQEERTLLFRRKSDDNSIKILSLWNKSLEEEAGFTSSCQLPVIHPFVVYLIRGRQQAAEEERRS